MGKAQSKRSIDITTETKKGAEEEVTGKLEKIEDLDQKQLNGDASPQEQQNETEKKETDETENDKDLTTEKSAADIVAQASGENVDQNSSSAAADSLLKEDKTAVAEEISPIADESIKKSKKEKVKKKWSFRSISFGRKDKQKPAKTEETAETTAATNGEADKSALGEVSEDQSKKDEAITDETVAAEKLENGNATEKELNGQKTPTSTDEKLTSEIAAAETITNTTTITATTTEAVLSSSSSVSVPAATSNNETAIEIQNEKKAAISNEIVEAAAAATTAAVATAAAIVSNGSEEVVKNGIETPAAAIIAEVQEAAAATTEVVVESNKITIPNVINNEGATDGEKPHQNGTNGDTAVATEIEAEQCKSQIEVKTNTVTNSPAENIDSSIQPSFSPTSDSDTIPKEPNVNSSSEVVSVVNNDDEIVAAAAAAADAVVDNAAINIATVIVDVVSPDNCSSAIAASAQIDIKPPPLPISPPPSQVSVFAFNDDSSAATTQISTNEMQAENLPTSSSSSLSAPPQTENFAIEEEESVPENKSNVESHLNITAAPPAVQEDLNIKTKSETSTSLPAITETLTYAAVAAQDNSNVVNELKTTTTTTADKANLIEIVNEITEQAIEIVEKKQEAETECHKIEAEQQELLEEIREEQNEIQEEQKQAENVLEGQQQAEITKVEQEITEIKEVEVIVEKSEEIKQKEDDGLRTTILEVQLERPDLVGQQEDAIEIEELKVTTTTTNITAEPETKPEIIDEIIDEHKLKTISAEIETMIVEQQQQQQLTTPPTAVDVDITKTLNKNKEDCALLLEASLNQFEKLTLNDDDAEACNEIVCLSSTKEIANAKDLKEIAAEKKIQDLPVTCE